MLIRVDRCGLCIECLCEREGGKGEVGNFSWWGEMGTL